MMLRLTTVAWLALAVTMVPAVELDAPEECLVCRKSHLSADHEVDYRGRTFPLCSAACEARFRAAEAEGRLDPVTSGIEPRAMLFHEDSHRPAPLASRWFLAGLFVLVGLVGGGGAAALALRRGLPVARWFVVGFIAPPIGVVGAAFAKGDGPVIRRGRTKVTTTRDASPCPACGRTNHPAARECPACGGALTPEAPSEVDA